MWSTRGFVITIVVSLLSCVCGYKAGAGYDCVELKREDNSWQNWYAQNKCAENITLHYTTTDQGGHVSKGTGFAEPCKRTLINQWFLSDEVTFTDIQQGSKLCINTTKPNPTKAGDQSSDLSNRIAKAQRKADAAAATNQQSRQHAARGTGGGR